MRELQVRRKKKELSDEPHADSWECGDTVGCLLDLDRNEISFSLNGELLDFTCMPQSAGGCVLCRLYS